VGFFRLLGRKYNEFFKHPFSHVSSYSYAGTRVRSVIARVSPGELMLWFYCLLFLCCFRWVVWLCCLHCWWLPLCWTGELKRLSVWEIPGARRVWITLCPYWSFCIEHEEDVGLWSHAVVFPMSPLRSFMKFIFALALPLPHLPALWQFYISHNLIKYDARLNLRAGWKWHAA